MEELFSMKKRLIVLVCVWLAFMSSFILRLSWSSIMPLAIDQLNFSVQDGAKYISAFYFGYLLTVLPGGMLADKIGFRKAILGCLIGMAVCSVPMFWVENFYPGLIWRFLLGVSCGPLHASCMSAIGEFFTAKQRGRAVGLYMTASSAGITFVNMYAPFVAVNYGWNYAFLAVAIIPLIILVACYFGLKMPDDYKIIKRETKVNIPIKEQLKQIVTNRNILILAFTGMLATGASWGTTSWANLYMNKELGLGLVTAGKIMSIYGIAAIFAKPISGFLSDSLPIKSNKIAAFCLFLLAPTIIIFINTPTPNMLYITGPILGIGAFSYSTLTNMLAITTAPENMRGTTVGFINVFNQIGSFAAPILLGKVVAMTGSFADSLLVLAIFPVVGALALLCMKIK